LGISDPLASIGTQGTASPFELAPASVAECVQRFPYSSQLFFETGILFSQGSDDFVHHH
jgi:hypothetical protein